MAFKRKISFAQLKKEAGKLDEVVQKRKQLIRELKNMLAEWDKEETTRQNVVWEEDEDATRKKRVEKTLEMIRKVQKK